MENAQPLYVEPEVTDDVTDAAAADHRRGDELHPHRARRAAAHDDVAAGAAGRDRDTTCRSS